LCLFNQDFQLNLTYFLSSHTLFVVFLQPLSIPNFITVMRSLARLKKGDHAIIRSFNDDALSNKLIEMGCLPGEKITLSKIAPLGCPIAIHVNGYELSLRKDEADTVIVELVA
jgi:ferrous iron transport protein A